MSNEREEFLKYLAVAYRAEEPGVGELREAVLNVVNWVIVLVGIILALGWGTAAPPAMFLVGVVILLIMLVFLTHFDRQYHIQKEFVDIIKGKYREVLTKRTKYPPLNIEKEMKEIDALSEKGKAQKTVKWSIAHMMKSSYGILFITLIIVHLLSYLLKLKL
jgi:uncharacterized membrane protein